MKNMFRKCMAISLGAFLMSSMMSGLAFASPSNPAPGEVVYVEGFEDLVQTPQTDEGVTIQMMKNASKVNNASPGAGNAQFAGGTNAKDGNWAMKVVADNNYFDLSNTLIPGKEYKVELDIKTGNTVQFWYAVNANNFREFKCQDTSFTADTNYTNVIGPVSFQDLPAGAKNMAYSSYPVSFQLAMPAWISYNINTKQPIPADSQVLGMQYGTYSDFISLSEITDTYRHITLKNTVKVPALTGIDAEKITANLFEMYIQTDGTLRNRYNNFYIDNIKFTCIGDSGLSLSPVPYAAKEKYQDLIAVEDFTPFNMAIVNPDESSIAPATREEWLTYDGTKKNNFNPTNNEWWRSYSASGVIGAGYAEGDDTRWMLPTSQGKVVGQSDSNYITSLENDEYCVSRVGNYAAKWFYNSNPFQYQNNGTLFNTPEYLLSTSSGRMNRGLPTDDDARYLGGKPGLSAIKQLMIPTKNRYGTVENMIGKDNTTLYASGLIRVDDRSKNNVKAFYLSSESGQYAGYEAGETASVSFGYRTNQGSPKWNLEFRTRAYNAEDFNKYLTASTDDDARRALLEQPDSLTVQENKTTVPASFVDDARSFIMAKKGDVDLQNGDHLLVLKIEYGEYAYGTGDTTTGVDYTKNTPNVCNKPTKISLYLDPKLNQLPENPLVTIETDRFVPVRSVGYNMGKYVAFDEMRLGTTYESVTPLSNYRLPVTKAKVYADDADDIKGAMIQGSNYGENIGFVNLATIPANAALSGGNYEAGFENTKTYKYMRILKPTGDIAAIKDIKWYSADRKLIVDNEADSSLFSSDAGVSANAYTGINLGGMDLTVEPVLSPGSISNDNKPIEVSITEGAGGVRANTKFYYTTDGKDPTVEANRSEYIIGTTKIEIGYGESKTVKAVAVENGKQVSEVVSAAYSVMEKLEAPSFLPVSPKTDENKPFDVTITAAAGTTIRYTTDGSNPTETTGTVYTQAIKVNYGEAPTIKAIAMQNGKVTSAVATASYGVKARTANPAFVTPAELNANQPFAIEVTIPANTKVYYALNDKDPETDLTDRIEYKQGDRINVDYGQNKTIKIVAIEEGKAYSEVIQATYAVKEKLAKPVILPGAIEQSAMPLSVEITAEDGAMIKYTLDGTQPSETHGIEYTQGIDISYGESKTVKAIAIKEGKVSSDVETVSYSVRAKSPAPSFKTAAITNSDMPIDIEINIPENNKVYYVIGADKNPMTDADKIEYIAGAKINVSYGESKTIRMVAIQEGVTAYSEIVEASYSVKEKLAKPVILPETIAQSAMPLSVEITAEDGAMIKYTLDGTQPSETHGIEYVKAIDISYGESKTVKAIAIKEGKVSSDVETVSYSVRAKSPAPSFKTAAMTNSDKPIDIEINIPENNKVYYVIGADKNPMTDADKIEYIAGAKINVSYGESKTIRMVAIQEGVTAYSEIVEASYSVKEKLATPKVVTKVNSKTTTISGTCVSSDAAVKIYKGTKLLGTKTVSGGKFSVKIKKQAPGSILKVYAVKNNCVNSDSVTVKVGMEKTTVKKVTSKSKYVTGTAAIGSKVTVKIGSKKYKTVKVGSKGTYKVAIKKVKRGQKITVKAVYGKLSSTVNAKVK